MRPCRCPARQWPRRAAQNWPTGTGFPCCPQGTACPDSSGSWPVDLTEDSYLGHPCFSLLVPPVVPCVGVLGGLLVQCVQVGPVLGVDELGGKDSQLGVSSSKSGQIVCADLTVHTCLSLRLHTGPQPLDHTAEE